MYPTLTIGPLPFLDETARVPSYLAIRVLYLLVAPWLAVRLTAPLGIRPRDTLVLFLVGILAGVIGALLRGERAWRRWVTASARS